ncbi:MAG: carbamate kinase [Erysipelotrichaceae bacterium]|jgi:carbamate kinase|nr:carbamate kinase [Erysipelotrichaceae bacterium]
MAKYVVSLGGNALGNNAQEQKQALVKVAEAISDLIIANHQVAIVHGNGPQVGMINLAFESSKETPNMPFPECGAMSEGYIGYHIQNALYNCLRNRNYNKTIATIVTQVLVDPNDSNFSNPTKPIGAFYTKDEATKIALEKGYTMKEDAGRGYRRVIASPLPIDIIEKETIKVLLENGQIVVCAGGGGIPVIEVNCRLEGIDAVIDKDYASSKLAELINADYLVILTAVDNVLINYRKENEKKLTQVNKEELEKYLLEGHFAKGSMYPKVQAAINFITANPGKTAIIASLDNAVEAFKEKAGTIIK